MTDSDILAYSSGFESVIDERGQGSRECDCEEGSTYESSEVVFSAVLTNSINDLLCDRIAVKESGDGGYTEAEVKVSRSDVVTYIIEGG